MNKEIKTIDEYIEDFSPETQEILEQIRQTIKKELPDGEEAMRYGMPTFRLNGKNLIHFAAFKHHIGLFPTPGPIEHFKKELERYETSKGGIQFPLNKPIPLELIIKIVQFRIKQVKGFI